MRTLAIVLVFSVSSFTSGIVWERGTVISVPQSLKQKLFSENLTPISAELSEGGAGRMLRVRYKEDTRELEGWNGGIRYQYGDRSYDCRKVKFSLNGEEASPQQLAAAARNQKRIKGVEWATYQGEVQFVDFQVID